MKNRRYIIRKMIMARSAAEAMTKDSKTPVTDVFLDEAWLAENDRKEIGFRAINKRKAK